MALSVLSFIKHLSNGDVDSLQTIIGSISDRLDFYEDREPESSGITYDNWEEKRDATEELLEYLQDIMDSIETPEDLNNEIISNIQKTFADYQSDIGGLSRWF